MLTRLVLIFSAEKKEKFTTCDLWRKTLEDNFTSRETRFLIFARMKLFNLWPNNMWSPRNDGWERILSKSNYLKNYHRKRSALRKPKRVWKGKSKFFQTLVWTIFEVGCCCCCCCCCCCWCCCKVGEVEKGEEEAEVVVEVDAVEYAWQSKILDDLEEEVGSCTSELLRSRGWKAVVEAAAGSSRLVTGPLTLMMCVLANTDEDFCSKGCSESSWDFRTAWNSWLLVLLRRTDVILLSLWFPVDGAVAVVGDEADDESRDARLPVTVMTVDVTGGDGGEDTPEIDMDFGEIWKCGVKRFLSKATLKAISICGQRQHL